MGARDTEAIEQSLSKIAYLIAVLEGCACLVADFDEERHNPRFWLVVAALNSCKDDLDELDDVLSKLIDL